MWAGRLTVDLNAAERSRSVNKTCSTALRWHMVPEGLRKPRRVDIDEKTTSSPGCAEAWVDYSGAELTGCIPETYSMNWPGPVAECPDAAARASKVLVQPS